MSAHAVLGLTMLIPTLSHAAPRPAATTTPVRLQVAANNHIQGLLFHGNDEVTIKTDLSGPNTGLDLNSGLAFAPDGSFWSANVGVLGHPPALEHFAKGATGNTAPLAKVTCGLAETTNVAVDKLGNVYALNRQAMTVAEFSPTANGCATPIAVIGGSKTGLSQGMLAINIDDKNRIYVGDFQFGHVLVFAPGSNGNVPPIGVLHRGLSAVSAITFDAQKNLYVGNIDLGTIAVFAPNTFGPNVKPIRFINGGLAAAPQALAVTRDGRLFSLNFVAGDKLLFEYPPNANGNIQPTIIAIGRRSIQRFSSSTTSSPRSRVRGVAELSDAAIAAATTSLRSAGGAVAEWRPAHRPQYSWRHGLRCRA